MSATTEVRSCLEMALGDIGSLPKRLSTGKLLEVELELRAFDRLVAYWKSLPVASRPRLCGLSASKESRPSLQLVLEIGARVPLLLISVEKLPGQAFPTMAEVWPFSAWWQAELEEFDGIAFSERAREGGVAWQHI